MSFTEYKILKANGVDRLNQLIADAIANGFQPTGEIILLADGYLGHAVGKPEEEPEEESGG